MFTLQFESKLHGPRQPVWDWMTSVQGIATELKPFLRMTVPRDLRNISDLEIQPGVRLFRSVVFLFGLIPVDYSDLTLVHYERGTGFIEESPVGSMKTWRHERRLSDCPSDPSSILLTDRLTFEPRWGGGAVGWFIRKVFEHRHRVLRGRFGKNSAILAV